LFFMSVVTFHSFLFLFLFVIFIFLGNSYDGSHLSLQ
jgi:hypothetical protein